MYRGSYKALDDTVLLSLIKEQDKTAENELYYRYRGFSVVLTRELKSQYHSVVDQEFDDLVGIGLIAFYKALDSYNATGKFYSYWRKIAYHEMIRYISEASQYYAWRNSCYNSKNIIKTFESEDEGINKDMILEDIERILNDVNNNIKSTDKDMFYDYLNSLTYNEIAAKYGISYMTAKRRIEKISQLIANILFNN